MRPGVRLGVDVGTARIGVARSDADGLLAVPVETVARDRKQGSTDLDRIAALVQEYSAIEVIVGLPLALSGRQTASTGDAERFARRCAARLPVPVRMLDERLTTVSAQDALHASGRSTRGFRPVIDQVAAVILVQHALDIERSSGRVPGALVDTTSDRPTTQGSP